MVSGHRIARWPWAETAVAIAALVAGIDEAAHFGNPHRPTSKRGPDLTALGHARCECVGSGGQIMLSMAVSVVHPFLT